jgi:hypothetical protein
MEYNQEIIIFCERKLFPCRPEYLNCISALYISGIGLYNLLKLKERSLILEIIYWCLITNGFMSFLFHYTAWYMFKLLDEFSMIIPLWIGISKILYDLHYSFCYIGLLTTINILLLGLDVFPWFEPYFPLVFTSELLLIIPLYYQLVDLTRTNTIIRKYIWISNKGIQGILICSISGVIWFITELNCNIYLILGHSIWHIGMSTGLCYIIEYFNKLTKNNI